MAPRSRIACLAVPALPLQAVLRAEPKLLGTALAVTRGSGDRAPVLAATLLARNSGVRAGLTAAQARAICAGLTVREATEALITAAGDALYDVASAFSPCIERQQTHVLLEVGDLGQLFPSEQELCAALVAHADKVGLRVNVALSDHKATAHILARCRLGITLIPAGGERLALAPLPILALGLPPAQEALIARFGLRTIGEFARLPRQQLAVRLGAQGPALHRLACGEELEPLCPTPAPLAISESVELDDPLDNLEPLSFLLRGLLDRAVSRLTALCQSCGDYTLHLQLTHGSEERRIAVAAPTREVAPLLELARILLAAKPPAAPVRALAVHVVPSRPRAVQMSLFAPAGPRPEQLAVTLARLHALCGEGRVGTPVVPDTHLPGQAAVIPFVEPPPAPTAGALPTAEPAAPSEQPPHLLATHVLRPPPAATVHTRGPLIEFLHTETVAGPVRRCGGPYRLREGGGGRILRDYYDVELNEGGVYRLFHDLHSDRWYLDARYD